MWPSCYKRSAELGETRDPEISLGLGSPSNPPKLRPVIPSLPIAATPPPLRLHVHLLASLNFPRARSSARPATMCGFKRPLEEDPSLEPTLQSLKVQDAMNTTRQQWPHRYRIELRVVG